MDMFGHTDESDKAWKRKANRFLNKYNLKLATYDEAGWYYNVVVDGEAVNCWVTDK